MKLFCPKCGSQAAVPTSSENGGQLYVAEDMGSSTEVYDDAEQHTCEKCNTVFYLGGTSLDQG